MDLKVFRQDSLKAFIKVFKWDRIVSDHLIVIVKERTLSVDHVLMTCRQVLCLVARNRLTFHCRHFLFLKAGAVVFGGQAGLRHKSETFIADEFSLFLLS